MIVRTRSLTVKKTGRYRHDGNRDKKMAALTRMRSKPAFVSMQVHRQVWAGTPPGHGRLERVARISITAFRGGQQARLRRIRLLGPMQGRLVMAGAALTFHDRRDAACAVSRLAAAAGEPSRSGRHQSSRGRPKRCSTRVAVGAGTSCSQTAGPAPVRRRRAFAPALSDRKASASSGPSGPYRP
jgi:hypothetical protein